MSTASATMGYTANASGEPYPYHNGIKFNYYDNTGGYVQPDWTYKPNIVNPIWENPTPNIWPIVPTQPTITFPAIQTSTPAWSFACPHCGHNHQINNYMNFTWICDACHQSMLQFQITTTGGGTSLIPSTPAPAATPEAKEMPKPEKKEHHPGDGSRWEDI